jgi:hypothetical protein
LPLIFRVIMGACPFRMKLTNNETKLIYTMVSMLM